MKTFLERMFAYDRWSNQQILGWLLTNPDYPEMRKIFVHLIAEYLPWLHLLRGEEVPADVDPEPDWSLSECREMLDEVMDALQSFVRNSTDESLQAIVRSPGPNHQVFGNTAAEVLTALLNHGEHHRGQLIYLIGQATGEYVPSVYMSYLRKLPAAAQA